MDVGDDRNAHRSRATLAKRAGVLAAAFLWVGAGALLLRTEVPRLDLPRLDPREYFAAGALERIDRYRRVTRALLILSLALQFAVVGLLAWKAAPLADTLSGPLGGRVRTGVGMGVAVVLALWLALLPLGAFSHLWRRRYGLSEQGYMGWLRDAGVSLGIRAVLVAVAAAGAVFLAAKLGPHWWLAGAPALVAVGVAFTLAQPLVVEPLFNRFRPVDDPALARDVRALAGSLGVRVDDVLVADASRRTTAGNAYVSGLGPTKRVVLYDTLLDGRFDGDEVRSVAAHELAHVARHHLWKGLAWFALLAVPGLFLLAWVTERRGGLGDPALVPLAALVVLVFLLVTAPLQSAVSRRYEAEADWLALRATNDPAAAVGLDRQLVLTNLSDPDPPAWLHLWLSTHPTAMERIAMAEAFRSPSAARAGS